MADRMLPHDSGGYKFPFVFAVAPWTDNFFGLCIQISKAYSSHDLMTELTWGNVMVIWQTVQFKLQAL
jgi:hypothetical protein